MISRKDSVQQLEKIKELFHLYIGKDLVINFGNYSFPIRIETKEAITLARQVDLVNKPNKRIDSEGKKYTPAVMQIQTTVGILEFYIEDFIVSSIVQGLRFRSEAIIIDIKVANG